MCIRDRCAERATRAQSIARRTAVRPAAAHGRHFAVCFKRFVRFPFTLGTQHVCGACGRGAQHTQ
eukprot:3729063-Prymnesium_polylepis.1